MDTTKGIGAALKGLLFAIVGGGMSAAATAAFNYKNYSGPIDWTSLMNAGAIGALLGAGAWFNGHQQLWKPVPGTVAVPFDQLKAATQQDPKQ